MFPLSYITIAYSGAEAIQVNVNTLIHDLRENDGSLGTDISIPGLGPSFGDYEKTHLLPDMSLVYICLSQDASL